MPLKVLILKLKLFLTQTLHHLETEHHYDALSGARIFYSICRFPSRQRIELEHLIERMLEIQRRELCCRRTGRCINPQIGIAYGLNLVSGLKVNLYPPPPQKKTLTEPSAIDTGTIVVAHSGK